MEAVGKEKNKHYLETIKWGVIPITSYKGCHVTKDLKTGLYSILGHSGLTEEGVDRLIDDSLRMIEKSIKQ